KVKTKKDEYGNPYYLVFNEKDYPLTTFLENGHLIANKKGGVGWSSARPHIRPAFEKAKESIDKIVAQKSQIKIETK
ncbi:MAG: hypothetical protein Q4E99_05365, partial [Bacillota bacterium]|nr:hypothetical protein [Bacillota bacterium]